MALRPTMLLLVAALVATSIALLAASRQMSLPTPWQAVAELGPAVACIGLIHGLAATIIVKKEMGTAWSRGLR